MGKKDIPMNLKGHKVYLSVNFGLLASNNSSQDTGGGTTWVYFSNLGLVLYSHNLIFVPQDNFCSSFQRHSTACTGKCLVSIGLCHIKLLSCQILGRASSVDIEIQISRGLHCIVCFGAYGGSRMLNTLRIVNGLSLI